VALLAKAWMATARARRRLRNETPVDPVALLRAHVRDRTVVDVGCMWFVDGGFSFAAEDGGATAVTGVDLMPPSEAFEAERARRGSSMRFVQGDINDPAVVDEVGEHDVVWCSGVLYHVPNPLLTLQRLHAVCREQLLLRVATVPELPGAPGACVFYPAGRGAYAPAGNGQRAIGVTEPFDPDEGYGNWFWGVSPSALRAMLGAADFVVDEVLDEPFLTTVLARPR
jgi:SAM-dependent methyltransferase